MSPATLTRPCSSTMLAIALARMMPGLASSPPQLPEWCAPSRRFTVSSKLNTPREAEKQGRARGGQTRAVGGDENIRRKLFGMRLAERTEARRAVFFAHFQQQFDVETQRAVARLEGLFERGQIDQVLAFVIRRATAGPALPLRIVTAHHVHHGHS